MTKAMRFGIQTGPQHVSWGELVDIWQVADGLKFDTAWTFDHFFPIMSDPKGSQLEGWVALTALAMKTQQVRVGTLVTASPIVSRPCWPRCGRRSMSSPAAGWR